MPTIRRRTPARRGTAVLDSWIEFGLTYGPFSRQSVDELEEAWEIHGEDVLTAFVEQHPGHRPWAWWQFEARHPRRELNAPLVRDEGLDNAKRGGVVLIGNSKGALVPWLESEAAYLTRHKLWLPGERARFNALEVES